MKNILFSIYLLISTIAFAQSPCTIQVSGSVTDKHNSTLLNDATIQFINDSNIVTTTVNGLFELNNLCPGTYSVLVYHPLCEPISQEILIQNDLKIHFELEHHIEELSAISISGKAVNSLQNKLNLKEELADNSSKTLGDVLEAINGVTTLKTGTNIVKPMVRSFHSTRLPILNNGIKQEEMEWGMEHSPRTNLLALEYLKIVRGADVLKSSSEGFGGIIKMEPKAILKADSSAIILLSALESNGKGGIIGASLQTTNKNNWFFNASTSFKKFGDRESPDYILSNTGFEDLNFASHFGKKSKNKTFSIYYDFDKTNIGILKAAHIGNMNDLVEAINANQPTVINEFTYSINKPYQQIQHHFLKANFNYQTNRFGKFNMIYGYQNHRRKEFDNRIGEVKDTPNMDMLLQTHTAKLDWLYEEGIFWRFSSGIEFNHQNNKSNPNTQVKRLIPDYFQNHVSGFASVEHNPTRLLKWKAAVRFDYKNIDSKKYYYKRFWEDMGYNNLYTNNIIGDFGNQYLVHFQKKFFNYSAAFDIDYKINRDLNLNFNYSYLSRTPNVSELFSEGLHHSAASIELGDIQIKSEKNHQFNLDILGKFSSKFQYSTSLYLNRINDYIQQVPIGAQYTIRGAFPVWQYKQQDAILYGLEVDALYKISSKFTLYEAFSIQEGKEIKNKNPLINIPTALTNGYLSYKLKDKKKTNFNVNWKYVFNQKHYPDYNFMIETISNGNVVNRLVDISTPEDAYLLMGIDAETTFKIKNTSLIFSGSIDNLFNKKYRNTLNRLRYYADDMGRNFKLQLTFKF